MVKHGLAAFKNKHILLLQGPVGPFFQYFSNDLKHVGAIVHKINFNGGDLFFSSIAATNYTGSYEDWPHFFTEFIHKYKIDNVILFGDCRAYHSVAHTIASQQGIEVSVFEEGYIRPDYITFEEYGVNGYSQLSRDSNFYRSLDASEFLIPETVSAGNTFGYAAWWAILYYFYSALLFPFFRHYRHHRPLTPWESVYWIRSFFRKWWYKYNERGFQHILITEKSKKYFLIPLQISTDAQVINHSSFNSVEHFIESVISSFAAYAPKDTWLVIKHHPLDRGYHDYSKIIKVLANNHGMTSRVKYIHDQHLPALLEHSRGTIVINSTVGLSSIHHNTPLKVCGNAIYDLEGLTFQGSLDEFWYESEKFEIDRDFYKRFHGYIIQNKQVNGNFYRRLKSSNLISGIIW